MKQFNQMIIVYIYNQSLIINNSPDKESFMKSLKIKSFLSIAFWLFSMMECYMEICLHFIFSMLIPNLTNIKNKFIQYRYRIVSALLVCLLYYLQIFTALLLADLEGKILF